MYDQVYYVRSCKYDLRKPDRSRLHVAFDAMHSGFYDGKDPKTREKASGSDLAAEFSHVCIAFSIAFGFDPIAPNQTTTLAKCNRLATSSL